MTQSIVIPTFLILWAFCCQTAHAQQKYEKESRIKESEVPTQALAFIDSLEIEGKMRWYLEESIDHQSVEAKFKLNDQKYSIEFDLEGKLKDVEIQMPWIDLPQVLRDSISSHLKRDCKRSKVRKVQIQYTGPREVLLSRIKTGIDTDNYVVRYELVIKCAQPGDVSLYEYLFSDTGQALSRSLIIIKNSTNLEY